MKNTPPTDTLPLWAQWLGQDADGHWWAFEAEPNEYDQGWYENEVGRYLNLGSRAPNTGWRDSLQKISRGSSE